MPDNLTLPEMIQNLETQLAAAHATLATASDAKAVEALRAQLNLSTTENATLEARVAELEANAASNAASLESEVKKRIAAIEAKHAAELATVLASVEDRAGARAVEIMASVGQPYPLRHDAKREAGIRPDFGSYREEYGEPTKKPAASALDRAVAGMGAMFKRTDKI